jgi:hypothetical protein
MTDEKLEELEKKVIDLRWKQGKVEKLKENVRDYDEYVYDKEIIQRGNLFNRSYCILTTEQLEEIYDIIHGMLKENLAKAQKEYEEAGLIIK